MRGEVLHTASGAAIPSEVAELAHLGGLARAEGAAFHGAGAGVGSLWGQ